LSAIRTVRWIFLLCALGGCIGWSYIAINHMLEYSTNQQQRRDEYESMAHTASAQVHDTDLQQQYWGKVTMFAVACSFFFLLAVMMNWVLDGRPRRRPPGELR
jgi:NADH:ubiquinone oxidoreductase subunit 3 (subunit A)